MNEQNPSKTEQLASLKESLAAQLCRFGGQKSPIMTVTDLQALLDRQIDYLDRDQAESKLNECINAIGASVKIKAQAFGELEKAKAKVIRNNPDPQYRMLKMKIDQYTTDEQEAYMTADRLHVSLFKVIDGLKALLSIQDRDTVSWKG